MPHEEFYKYPWYYRDVPTGILLAFVVLAALTTVAVEFRPIRSAPPVTVVSHGDSPTPWKAPLPNQLPVPSFPAIPPPPVIPPPTQRYSAVDTILSQGVSLPDPPPQQQRQPK